MIFILGILQISPTFLLCPVPSSSGVISVLYATALLSVSMEYAYMHMNYLVNRPSPPSDIYQSVPIFHVSVLIDINACTLCLLTERISILGKLSYTFFFLYIIEKFVFVSRLAEATFYPYLLVYCLTNSFLHTHPLFFFLKQNLKIRIF